MVSDNTKDLSKYSSEMLSYIDSSLSERSKDEIALLFEVSRYMGVKKDFRDFIAEKYDMSKKDIKKALNKLQKENLITNDYVIDGVVATKILSFVENHDDYKIFLNLEDPSISSKSIVDYSDKSNIDIGSYCAVLEYSKDKAVSDDNDSVSGISSETYTLDRNLKIKSSHFSINPTKLKNHFEIVGNGMSFNVCSKTSRPFDNHDHIVNLIEDPEYFTIRLIKELLETHEVVYVRDVKKFIQKHLKGKVSKSVLNIFDKNLFEMNGSGSVIKGISENVIEALNYIDGNMNEMKVLVDDANIKSFSYSGNHLFKDVVNKKTHHKLDNIIPQKSPKSFIDYQDANRPKKDTWSETDLNTILDISGESVSLSLIDNSDSGKCLGINGRILEALDNKFSVTKGHNDQIIINSGDDSYLISASKFREMMRRGYFKKEGVDNFYFTESGIRFRSYLSEIKKENPTVIGDTESFGVSESDDTSYNMIDISDDNDNDNYNDNDNDNYNDNDNDDSIEYILKAFNSKNMDYLNINVGNKRDDFGLIFRNSKGKVQLDNELKAVLGYYFLASKGPVYKDDLKKYLKSIMTLHQVSYIIDDLFSKGVMVLHNDYELVLRNRGEKYIKIWMEQTLGKEQVKDLDFKSGDFLEKSGLFEISSEKDVVYTDTKGSKSFVLKPRYILYLKEVYDNYERKTSSVKDYDIVDGIVVETESIIEPYEV
ncbi:MAG: hypothetical protein K0B02_05315 [DPANN group archaeon]|nr:hypothetical protein [DPANN group archaeon]